MIDTAWTTRGVRIPRQGAIDIPDADLTELTRRVIGSRDETRALGSTISIGNAWELSGEGLAVHLRDRTIACDEGGRAPAAAVIKALHQRCTEIVNTAAQVHARMRARVEAWVAETTPEVIAAGVAPEASPGEERRLAAPKISSVMLRSSDDVCDGISMPVDDLELAMEPIKKAISDARARAREEKEAAKRAREAEEEARLAAAHAATRAERIVWIEAHGSTRLRRLVSAGIEHERTYITERLALDRPGWVRNQLTCGRSDERKNATEIELDALDAARAAGIADAHLVWIDRGRLHDRDYHVVDCRDGRPDDDECICGASGPALECTHLGEWLWLLIDISKADR